MRVRHGGRAEHWGSRMSDSSPRLIKAERGVVKWFDPRKGFGFIVGPEGQDIFVHYTHIEGEGFRALRDNSEVEYDAAETEKGWKATRVVRLEQPEVRVRPTGRRQRSPRR
jgi:CspA family cold shock protein